MSLKSQEKKQKLEGYSTISLLTNYLEVIYMFKDQEKFHLVFLYYLHNCLFHSIYQEHSELVLGQFLKNGSNLISTECYHKHR